MMAVIRPFFSSSCCAVAERPLFITIVGIFLMAFNTMFEVSQPGAMANLIAGAWPGTMVPKTVIKIIGKSNANTIDVGLLSVASKLYFEMVNAALSWFGVVIFFQI